MHILVVEDDPAVSHSIQLMLRSENCTVHTTDLDREIGIAERLGDQINPDLPPARMHKGVARVAHREQHLPRPEPARSVGL